MNGCNRVQSSSARLLTKENKPCTHGAFADLGKLYPAGMTGAKLLGMHESVTSPTEYRSRRAALWLRGDAGVVERSYADDVWAFKP